MNIVVLLIFSLFSIYVGQKIFSYVKNFAEANIHSLVTNQGKILYSLSIGFGIATAAISVSSGLLIIIAVVKFLLKF